MFRFNLVVPKVTESEHLDIVTHPPFPIHIKYGRDICARLSAYSRAENIERHIFLSMVDAVPDVSVYARNFLFIYVKFRNLNSSRDPILMICEVLSVGNEIGANSNAVSDAS